MEVLSIAGQSARREFRDRAFSSPARLSMSEIRFDRSGPIRLPLIFEFITLSHKMAVPQRTGTRRPWFRRTPPAKKLAARGLRPPAAARRRLTNNIQLVDKAQSSQQVDFGLVVAGDGGCIVQAGLVGGILGHEHIDC